MTAHVVTLVYYSKSNNGDNFTQVVGAVDLTHRCVDGWMGLTLPPSERRLVLKTMAPLLARLGSSLKRSQERLP
jgi:hypothetical protein